jgi:hypothetical protein
VESLPGHSTCIIEDGNRPPRHIYCTSPPEQVESLPGHDECSTGHGQCTQIRGNGITEHGKHTV